MHLHIKTKTAMSCKVARFIGLASNHDSKRKKKRISNRRVLVQYSVCKVDEWMDIWMNVARS